MNNIVALEEVCEFLDNQRKPVTAKDRVSGKYPYYGANGIQDYVDQYLFDDELVLLAEDGGHFDDPSKGVAYRISGKSWVNNHAHVLKPKKNIDVDYLGYVLRQYDVRPYITGAIVKKLNQKAARKMLIPLPAIEKQKRIVEILDVADSLRQKRKQSILLLDDYLKSVFFEMFGSDAKNYNNWEIVKLEDLADNRKGSMRTGPFGSDLRHSEFADSGIAVIGIDNAVQNKFAWDERRFITKEKYEKLKRYTLYPHDVIITIMGTVGKSAVIPEDIPLSINTKHLAAITLDKQRANPYFISYSIHSNPEIIDQINRKGKGAIMTGLNLGIIKELNLKLPPIELQNKFVEIMSNTEAVKEKMINQSKELENQFQALMHTSFTSS